MAFDVHFSFDADPAVLVSSVRGILTPSLIEEWRTALHRSTNAMLPEAEFRFLSDLYEYEVADQDLAVHKCMREIGPHFLAAHGFPVGFWHLYEVTPPAPSRAGVCTHVAHLHRDCNKMERYNELLASPVERFFCDPDAARAWLRSA